MAAIPIIRVPVDTEEFDAFVDKFMAYQKLLETQGDAWANTNKGIRTQKTAFDDVDKSFSDLVHKATDNKFSGPGGSFVKVQKTSKETEKSWKNIARDLEKSAKSMGGLARTSLSFSGVGGLLGVGGLAAAGMGVFNAVRGADSSLADQNILNRKLGLKPGEEQAFTQTYEQAGGDDSLLHRVANAAAHQDQWKSFLALGIDQNQIQTLDATHLAALALQKGGEQYTAHGAGAGMWANATGVEGLLGMENMRASSTRSGQFDDLNKQFEKLIPTLAASEAQLEQATKAKQALDAALAKDELELAKAFIQLNPLVIKAADAVTDWVTAFAESKALTDDIHVVEDAFAKLGAATDWLTDKLNHPFHPGDLGHVGSDGAPVPFHINRDHPAGTFGRDPTGESPNFIAKWWNNLGRGNEASGGGDSSTGSGAAARDGLNNPGNLRVPGSTTQFQQFPTPDAGALAVDQQLQIYATRDHLDTLTAIISKYAPKADHNDTEAYIDDVRQRTGFGAAEALNMSDPKVRALIESAMIHHEGTPFARQFDTQHILDLLTKGTPFDDPKSLKAAKDADRLSGEPQILPMDAVDRKAIAEQSQSQSKTDSQVVSESLVDRLTRGLGVIGNTLREGGGSSLRQEDRTQQRIDRQGTNIQSSVNVTVSTPTGSSAVVTASTLAQ